MCVCVCDFTFGCKGVAFVFVLLYIFSATEGGYKQYLIILFFIV